MDPPRPASGSARDEAFPTCADHRIAAFKLRERLEVLDSFPLSPVGKVSKKDLVARYVTAGNASGVNDGAAAVLVASERAVEQYGLTPLARVSAAAVGR